VTALATLRERAALSQRDLEERSGVARNTIAAIERGEARQVRFVTRRKLAKALGVEPYAIDWPRRTDEPDAGGDAG